MSYDMQLGVIFGSALLTLTVTLAFTILRNHYRNRR